MRHIIPVSVLSPPPISERTFQTGSPTATADASHCVSDGLQSYRTVSQVLIYEKNVILVLVLFMYLGSRDRVLPTFKRSVQNRTESSGFALPGRLSIVVQ